MNGDLAELLIAEEILKVDEFVDANREKCIKASERNVLCVVVRYTNSEASTIVRME